MPPPSGVTTGDEGNELLRGDAMAVGDKGGTLRQVEHLLEGHALREASDAELLERFRSGGAEDAFTLLLARHGPMVLHVCGRLLPRPQDVEDVFQATFLLLVQKAG